MGGLVRPRLLLSCESCSSCQNTLFSRPFRTYAFTVHFANAGAISRVQGAQILGFTLFSGVTGHTPYPSIMQPTGGDRVARQKRGVQPRKRLLADTNLYSYSAPEVSGSFIEVGKGGREERRWNAVLQLEWEAVWKSALPRMALYPRNLSLWPATPRLRRAGGFFVARLCAACNNARLC